MAECPAAGLANPDHVLLKAALLLPHQQQPRPQQARVWALSRLLASRQLLTCRLDFARQRVEQLAWALACSEARAAHALLQCPALLDQVTAAQLAQRAHAALATLAAAGRPPPLPTPEEPRPAPPPPEAPWSNLLRPWAAANDAAQQLPALAPPRAAAAARGLLLSHPELLLATPEQLEGTLRTLARVAGLEPRQALRALCAAPALARLDPPPRGAGAAPTRPPEAPALARGAAALASIAQAHAGGATARRPRAASGRASPAASGALLPAGAAAGARAVRAAALGAPLLLAQPARRLRAAALALRVLIKQHLEQHPSPAWQAAMDAAGQPGAPALTAATQARRAVAVCLEQSPALLLLVAQALSTSSPSPAAPSAAGRGRGGAAASAGGGARVPLALRVRGRATAAAATGAQRGHSGGRKGEQHPHLDVTEEEGEEEEHGEEQRGAAPGTPALPGPLLPMLPSGHRLQDAAAWLEAHPAADRALRLVLDPPAVATGALAPAASGGAQGSPQGPGAAAGSGARRQRQLKADVRAASRALQPLLDGVRQEYGLARPASAWALWCTCPHALARDARANWEPQWGRGGEAAALGGEEELLHEDGTVAAVVRALREVEGRQRAPQPAAAAPAATAGSTPTATPAVAARAGRGGSEARGAAPTLAGPPRVPAPAPPAAPSAASELSSRGRGYVVRRKARRAADDE